VDVLVNNSSGFGITDDEAGWKISFDVDMMASVRASWKVVPWMKAQGGGSILHISSTSALEAGSPPSYAAAKAALISHSKTLAVALAPAKIRVNTIAPGSIEFPASAREREIRRVTRASCRDHRRGHLVFPLSAQGQSRWSLLPRALVGDPEPARASPAAMSARRATDR
jgi:NAD(P)-dependent dehydrogenase (short-subunit alcohol dehydrogenase family)